MKHRRPDRAKAQKLYVQRSSLWLQQFHVDPVMLYFRNVKVRPNQTHHTKRSIGELLLDERYWLPTSDQGHELCERLMVRECQFMGFNLSRGKGINDVLELRVLEMRRNLDFSDVPEYTALMKAIYPTYFKCE